MKQYFLLLLLLPAGLFAQNADPQYQSYLAHIAAANASFRLNDPAEAKRWTQAAPAGYRGWEWHYLNNLSDASLQSADLSATNPTSMAISPDHLWVALSGADGTIRLAETTHFQEKKTLNSHRAAVYGSAFSPDGQKLYSISRDTTLRCWDIASGRPIWTAVTGGYGLACVAIHPSGTQVAMASWRREEQSGVIGFISIFDARDGHLIGSTEFGVKPILGLAYSPDGSRLAAGNWDGQVGIWSTARLNVAPLVLDYADRNDYTAIDDLAFSPDGKQIISATKCGEPRIWDTESGKSLFELRGHRQAVMAVAYSPDGQLVYTAGDEGVIFTWNAANGQLLARQFGHSGRITRLCATTDGKSLLSLSADKSLRRWSAYGGLDFYQPGTRSEYVYAFGRSHDGKTIGMGAPDGQVSVWSNDGKMQGMVKCLPEALNALAFSPDGSRFVGVNWGSEACIWDSRSGQLVRRLDGLTSGGSGCAYSPDGRWIALALKTGWVGVWDAHTGLLTHKLDMPGGSYNVAFSPDGSLLAAAGNKGALAIWETSGFQLKISQPAHEQGIYALAFSPDGKQLLTAGEDKTGRIWNLADGRLVKEFKGHAQRIWSVAWSPDGKRVVLASADLNMTIWDPETGERVLTLPSSHPVYNLAFSPDGAVLLANQLKESMLTLRGK